QDVFDYSPVAGLIITDNIWNFSSASGAEPAGTFETGYYNGTPTGSYYYDQTFPPAANVPATYPFTVDMWTNASIVPFTGPWGNTVWDSAVTFGFVIPGYCGSTAVGCGNYDKVLFTSGLNGTKPVAPMFQVNGYHLTPIGLPADAEMVMTGPGGGSQTNLYAYNGTMGLSFWNTSTYSPAPNVWNFGFDTGESAAGIAEHWTTMGSVWMESGPSMSAPFWGITPNNNHGTITVTGTIKTKSSLTPWVFVYPNGTTYRYHGTGLDQAGWAPLVTQKAFVWDLPPGSYNWTAMYSHFDPQVGSFATSGVMTITLKWDNVSGNPGVYTPLMAWNNAQLTAQFNTGGDQLWNDTSTTYGGLSPYFTQQNDYFFPTFPGVLLFGTTAHVNLTNPASFSVSFAQSPWWSKVFQLFGIYAPPATAPSNQLSIQFYYTSNAAVWGANGAKNTLNQWVPFFNPYSAFFPWASIVLWDAANTVIGDNTFGGSGNGITAMNDYLPASMSNTIWGNTFYSDMLAYGNAPVAINEWEPGDSIWNNYIGSSVSELPTNLWSFGSQVNLDNWNLPNAKYWPATTVFHDDGFAMTGSVVGSTSVCGNAWVGYVPGSAALPYTDGGLISNGGDYCPGAMAEPLTVSETGLPVGTAWTATLTPDCAAAWVVTCPWMGQAPMTVSASTASSVMYGVAPGEYSWVAGTVAGASPGVGYFGNPDSGQLWVGTAASTVMITYVSPVISISSPTAGQALAAPLYNVSVAWGTTGTAASVSYNLQIEDAAMKTDELPKNLWIVGTATSYNLAYQSFAPQCYNVVMGIYNGTSAVTDVPAGDITTWPVWVSVPFCVQAGAVSTVLPGAPNGAQAAGNVPIAWSWSGQGGISTATITVFNGTTITGNVLVPQQSVGTSSDAYASGVLIATIVPSSGSWNATVLLSVEDMYGGPGNGFAFTNFTYTFMVNAPVVVPPPQPVRSTYWDNSTTTIWYNATGGSVAGLGINTLGAILLDLGIIIGGIIGIIAGMMLTKRKGSGGAGGAAMGGSADAAATAFRCPACDASFPDQGSLDSHRKTVHGA
ncbi:MAG: thermopsin family protease, partial [Euryarchaeota archaeon]|nr:thermopsin family protease [Euryarchaeota archaeon]